MRCFRSREDVQSKKGGNAEVKRIGATVDSRSSGQSATSGQEQRKMTGSAAGGAPFPCIEHVCIVYQIQMLVPRTQVDENLAGDARDSGKGREDNAVIDGWQLNKMGGDVSNRRGVHQQDLRCLCIIVQLWQGRHQRDWSRVGTVARRRKLP